MNYYQFHIGDFRSGTVNMSRQARWIYRDMLDIYYDTESPLPADIDVLLDMLGIESQDEKAIVEKHLRFKFSESEEGYTHEVCDKVITEYRAKAETARGNGRLGGRPKGKQNKPSGFQSGSDPVATANPVETGLKTNHKPLTINQEPKEDQNQDQKTLPQPRASTGLGAEFDGIDFTFSDQQLLKWQEAYPKTDVESEIKKAAVWAAANPNKAKKNWARFLNTWIAKVEQAKGPLEGSCPVDKIIDLYHRLCPAFSPVAVTTDKALRAAVVERWNESDEHQKSQFWVAFFKKAGNKASVFYRGENCIPRLEALMSRAIFRDIEESA